MSGYRGYRHYRGRNSGGKTVLSVILVLIILASVASMFLQKQVVYDDTGTPHFSLFQKKEKDTPQEDEELKLTIQSKQEDVQRLFSVAAAPLGMEDWRLARLAAQEQGDCSGVLLTAKDEHGHVCFDIPAMGGARTVKDDTTAALAEILQGDTAAGYTVAVMTCFRDPYAAGRDMDMALQTEGGGLFRDEDGVRWIDPGKPEARDYLCDIAVELAGQGFDELLLQEFAYPVTGPLEMIAYGETVKTRNVLAFLQEVRAATEACGVKLAVQLPEAVILEGSDNTAGLMLEDILSQVDRVYAVTTEEAAVDLAEKLAGKGSEFVPILPAGHGWEGNCVTVLP